MTDFEKVIEHLNEEYTEKYNKLKWLRDSGRSGDAVDELYSYCDQLEKAIDFLEDAPEQIEELESEVEELNHFRDAVETIARVQNKLNLNNDEDDPDYLGEG